MADDQRSRDQRSKGDVANGFLWLFFLHIGMAFLLAILLLFGSFISSPFLLGLAGFLVLIIGVSQLLYVGPAVALVYRRGLTETAKGLIIGAAVTFMLNATCWTIVLRPWTMIGRP